MKLYNTLSRRVEQVVPLQAGSVRMYSCGPTVYRFIHVGNLRTFAMADWLRRALEYEGLRVLHVKNITDVGHMRQELLDRGEDKLIAQARREGRTSAEIAAFYTEAFLRDEALLNILPAHVFPRATRHIPQMIAIVADLLAKGVAYQAGGAVYYDVTRFPRYGALSGNALAASLDALRRTEAGGDKRHPEDFPLWKPADPGREMSWDSPWGRGFPGWHIECSAMSIAYLGPQFDIHTGGVDNLFPHHEDEIAQSEAFTGTRFVNYWVHAQHLLADGQKMAKSAGNAYTLADVTARGFEPLALRYLFTTAHYRSRINFTFSSLQAAQTGLRRLRLALLALADGADTTSAETTAWLEEQRARFLAAVQDDLNLPRAMAVLWGLLRRDAATRAGAPERLAMILDLDRILGLDLAGWLDRERARRATCPIAEQGVDVPDAARERVLARSAARASGDFARADALREQIAALGFRVRDTLAGPLLVPRPAAEGLITISRSSDVHDARDLPDRYEFSVNLLAHDSCEDLDRAIRGILAHRHGRSLEVVIVDNGSTDRTLPYLRGLAREGLPDPAVGLQVHFADHDMGFAAGRNATMRASRGRIVVLLDTSIEPAGDIWTPLERALAEPSVGLVGPYALVTDDLKEFYETEGPWADAVEGYLMAFPRRLLAEVGLAEEKFRFYRLLDIYMSFMFKTSGYLVARTPEVAARVVKHPHREWYSLTGEEQVTRSKRNYDLFRRRWHHGQSLLVANYAPADRWQGHDQPRHLGGTHTHAPDELPPLGRPHTHTHQHWPDHSHAHPHSHGAAIPAGAGSVGSDHV